MDFREKLKYLVLETIAAVVLLTLLATVLWTTTGPAFDPPNGVLFWLLILFICAVIGGKITELLRAPPLLGMLFAGFILRNTTSMQIGAEISAVLRNIALTVILLRAGFGLDPKALAKLSAVCFRLSFSPCIVETIVAAVTTHFIVGLPWQWGFLLGFAISAVSPAVVVPGLISLSERKYGTDKGIPTLVIAAASVDDVLAITGFGVLLGVVFSHDTSLVWQILKGPTEATVGLIIGAFVGLFLWYVPHENLKFSSALPLHSNQQRLILSLLFGFAIVFLSLYLEWSGVGPLGALTLSFVAALRWRNNGYDVHVEQGLRFIWFFCQPFLFALIGAEVRLSTLDKNIVAS
ncbi:mitochondrial sodium/hydrogen exchanger 9B2-like isoform X2, partial [Leptotrombidium deliense]